MAGCDFKNVFCEVRFGVGTAYRTSKKEQDKEAIKASGSASIKETECATVLTPCSRVLSGVAKFDPALQTEFLTLESTNDLPDVFLRFFTSAVKGFKPHCFAFLRLKGNELRTTDKPRWHDLQPSQTRHYVGSKPIGMHGSVLLRAQKAEPAPRTSPFPVAPISVIDRKGEMETFRVVVWVKQARRLQARDSGGTSDPYVELRVAGMKARPKTPYVKRSVSPVWNYVLDFEVMLPKNLDNAPRINLVVMDKDVLVRDDVIGKVQLEFGGPPGSSPFNVPLDPSAPPTPRWLSLQPVTSLTHSALADSAGEVMVAPLLLSSNDHRFRIRSELRDAERAAAETDKALRKALDFEEVEAYLVPATLNVELVGLRDVEDSGSAYRVEVIARGGAVPHDKKNKRHQNTSAWRNKPNTRNPSVCLHMQFDVLLNVSEEQWSDVEIRVWSKPSIRDKGNLVARTSVPIASIMTEENRQNFEELAEQYTDRRHRDGHNAALERQKEQQLELRPEPEPGPEPEPESEEKSETSQLLPADAEAEGGVGDYGATELASLPPKDETKQATAAVAKQWELLPEMVTSELEQALVDVWAAAILGGYAAHTNEPGTRSLSS